MQQETLTVKFDGRNQVEVQTFAYSVLNFATVIKETNIRLGFKPVDIHIKSPKDGSVIVDLIATITQNQSLIPNSLEVMANLVESVAGVYALHSFISGRKKKEKKKAEGKIEIELEDSSKMTVAENVYNIYVNTPSIPNGISQHFSALNEDPAVSRFEVYTQDKKKIIDVPREDYPRLSIKQQFETENSRTFVEPAHLYVYKIVFDKTDRKWEFYYNGNRISASIADDEFYKLLDTGESFAKGDQLRADIEINQIFDETIGAFVNQSYRVIKVHEHIQRVKPQKLPFNKKLGNDENESSTK